MDFSIIHEPLKKTITEQLSNTISKGDFILGEAVTKFEKEFATFCGIVYSSWKFSFDK